MTCFGMNEVPVMMTIPTVKNCIGQICRIVRCWYDIDCRISADNSRKTLSETFIDSSEPRQVCARKKCHMTEDCLFYAVVLHICLHVMLFMTH